MKHTLKLAAMNDILPLREDDTLQTVSLFRLSLSMKYTFVLDGSSLNLCLCLQFLGHLSQQEGVEADEHPLDDGEDAD